MADVVHEHTTEKPSGDSGIGFLFGAIILGIILLLLFFYGLPYLRNISSGGGMNVNIPDKIDVNVNQPGGQAQ